jgi:hypothetical protein
MKTKQLETRWKTSHQRPQMVRKGASMRLVGVNYGTFQPAAPADYGVSKRGSMHREAAQQGYRVSMSNAKAQQSRERRAEDMSSEAKEDNVERAVQGSV